MSQVTLSLFCNRTNDASTLTLMPDAGGNYSLPLLDKVDPLSLRLMRVDDGNAKQIAGDEHLYFPVMDRAVLRIPRSWKNVHLTGVLVEGNKLPQYLMVLGASPKPIDAMVFGAQLRDSFNNGAQIPVGDFKYLVMTVCVTARKPTLAMSAGAAAMLAA